MSVPTIVNNEQGSKQVSGQYTEAGGSEFVAAMQVDPTGSNLSVDKSYTIPVQDKFKNLIQTNGEGMTFKTPADLGFFAGVNYFESVTGDKQAVHGGDSHSYTQGNETKQTGEAGPKQVEAAKNLQDATRKIDEKKIDTIENTKGSQVDCPNCSTSIATDGGMCLLDLAIRIIRIGIPNFPYPLDIIEGLLNFLGIPLLTPEPVKSLNGGQGCGSPGCKNGMVNSPQKAIQTANDQAASDLKGQQKQLQQYQQDMGGGGSHLMGPFMSDMALHVGHPETMNTAPTVALVDEDVVPYKLGHAVDKGKGLIPKTPGNTKKAIHSEPLMNPGSLFVSVTEKLKVVAGSPGIDVMSTGKINVHGAVTDISASHGELNLYSNNLTTLKGKNIIIDAKDRSGDTGVRIESDNTMVAGLLSVTGDLALKGSLIMDGGLHCTHITAPGERVSSGSTGDAHQVHSGATWNNPDTGLQATLYDTYDKLYKAVSRDLFNTLSLGIIKPPEIKTLIEETYHTLMLDLIVDNTFMPTGFATAWFAPPGAPVGSPLIVVGVAATAMGPAPVLAYVIPGQTLPVYNFTHNHNSPGNDHAHDYTSIQSSLPGTTSDTRQLSPEPSHVPTPAKTTGMGSKPGHKSLGGLCIPCINLGGGGGGAGSTYNITANGNNPFGDTNYAAVNGNFDTDGNLVPPPSIDIGCSN